MGKYDGRKEAAGIILFFCSVALTLMYYLPHSLTGLAGDLLRSIGFGLIGNAAFLIPIFVFYAAVDFFFEKRSGVSPIRVRSVIVFMVFFSALLAVYTVDYDFFRTLCVNDKTNSAEALKAIKLLWDSGIDSSLVTVPGNSGIVLTGGVLGGLISLSFVSILGKTVTIFALITFLIVHIILVFHISLKRTAEKTAQAIGKATSTAYRQVKQYRANPQTQIQAPTSSTPFVLNPEPKTNVPIYNVEYDPFNTKLQVDKETGFIDVDDTKPSASNGTLSYGEKSVELDSNSNSSADFTYTSKPMNPPLTEKVKFEVPSFLQKEKQQDFFDLGEDDEVEESPYDFSPTSQPTDSDYVPGRVRKPNLNLSLVDDGAPQNTEASSIETTDEPIEVFGDNHVTINADSSSQLEGRVIDTSASQTVDNSATVGHRRYSKRQQGPYRPAPVKLLAADPINKHSDISSDLRANAVKLENALRSFGVDTKVVNITHGPAITRYELTLATGVKVSRILALTDDIMLAMAAVSIRIEAPIPGKSAIGIEIPNRKTTAVHLRGLLETDEFRKSSALTVPLGRDIPGKPIMCDLSAMPHLLIAGSTGSGKSVCINTILTSLLCKSTPDMMRLILIDPKIVELSIYNGIPHLIMPVVTDSKKAAGTLRWAVIEMDRRYMLFAEASVRDIAGYNEYLKFIGEKTVPLIVIVIDELADLMIVASKDVEENISRLAAKARAAGIHLIIATQRPSVDVITGVIKANIPSRIAFAVSSGVDSRTILDSVGAEKLLGKGDMLYAPLSANKPVRGQGAFVSDKEVEDVVSYLKQNYSATYDESVIAAVDSATNSGSTSDSGANGDGGSDSSSDALLEQAVDIVLDAKNASVSILQRRLGIGYPRAARLIDVMEQKKYIGPFEGSKPRKVLITQTDWLEIKAKGNAD